MSRFGLAVGVRLVSRWTSVRIRFGSPFSASKVVVCGHCLIVTLSLTINETLEWLSPLPILMQSHSGGDSVAIGMYSSLFPYLHTTRPISPSLISLMVSVDVKHHVYLLFCCFCFVRISVPHGTAMLVRSMSMGSRKRLPHDIFAIFATHADFVHVVTDTGRCHIAASLTVVFSRFLTTTLTLISVSVPPPCYRSST